MSQSVDPTPLRERLAPIDKARLRAWASGLEVFDVRDAFRLAIWIVTRMRHIAECVEYYGDDERKAEKLWHLSAEYSYIRTLRFGVLSEGFEVIRLAPSPIAFNLGGMIEYACHEFAEIVPESNGATCPARLLVRNLIKLSPNWYDRKNRVKAKGLRISIDAVLAGLQSGNILCAKSHCIGIPIYGYLFLSRSEAKRLESLCTVVPTPTDVLSSAGHPIERHSASAKPIDKAA